LVLSVQFAGPAYGGQPVMDAYGMNLGMNMGPPVSILALLEFLNSQDLWKHLLLSFNVHYY